MTWASAWSISTKLVENFTVLDNILLGHEPIKGLFIDHPSRQGKK